MNRLLLVLVPGMIMYTYGCSDNPAGPGNGSKGFGASTDSSSYSAGSQVTVTVRNGSRTIGLFSSCGSMWDFVLQNKSDGDWTTCGTLNCLAIYPWMIIALAPDSSHSVTFRGAYSAGISDSTVEYRFLFRFGVFPDSSLSDSLFSNSFSVMAAGK